MKKTEQGMNVVRLMRDLMRTEMTAAILDASRIEHRVHGTSSAKLTQATIGERYMQAIDALAQHAEETQLTLIAELERLP